MEFDVMAKFPQLRQMPRPSPFQAVSTSELYYHLAYACLNFRGAVVHGQAIDCTYQVPVNLVETSQTPATIEAVWAEEFDSIVIIGVVTGGNHDAEIGAHRGCE